MGPTYATAQLLEETGIDFKEIELVELNEAFAAQVIANQKAFGSKKYCMEKLGREKEIGELSNDILNVNGGAIALGHPVGATGARIVIVKKLNMNVPSCERPGLNAGPFFFYPPLITIAHDRL